MRLDVSAPPAYYSAPQPPPPPLRSSAPQDKIFPLRCQAGLSKDRAGLPAHVSKPAAQDKTAPRSCRAGLTDDNFRALPSQVNPLEVQDEIALPPRWAESIEGGIRTDPAHVCKIAAHDSIFGAQDKIDAVPCFLGCAAEGVPAHVSRQVKGGNPAQDGKWEVGEIRSEEGASSESSSIGVPEDSDDAVLSTGDDDEEEVHSQLGGGLGSLGSLEDSLPIKRGLSNHFTGKSKSFGNLAEVSSVHELVKPENPFNKRRRTLMACKRFTRPSSPSPPSLYCSPTPISMPVILGALNEDGGDADAVQDQQDRLRESNRKIVKAFRSPSCFPLSDLQQRA